jgi:hypothetical protein
MADRVPATRARVFQAAGQDTSSREARMPPANAWNSRLVQIVQDARAQDRIDVILESQPVRLVGGVGAPDPQRATTECVPSGPRPSLAGRWSCPGPSTTVAPAPFPWFPCLASHREHG